MGMVTINIDGKTYRMACNEGQEKHLTDISHRFNRYISHLKTSFGETGDHRLAVMAGIMVIDEMFQLEKRLYIMKLEIATLEQENQALRDVQNINTDYEKIVIEKLNTIAKRIMLLANRLSPQNQFRYPLIENSRSEKSD